MQHKDLRAEHCELETPTLCTPGQLLTQPQWCVPGKHPNKTPLGPVCLKLIKGTGLQPCVQMMQQQSSSGDLLSPCLPDQQLHAPLLGKSSTSLPQNICPSLISPQQQLHQLSRAFSLRPCPEGGPTGSPASPEPSQWLFIPTATVAARGAALEGSSSAPPC